MEDAMLNVNDWWVGPHPLLQRATHVWMQGCPRRCPGCCNTEALEIGQGGLYWTPEQLAALCRDEPRGLVLSGGEPFFQAGPLARACELVRDCVPDIPIVAYTGYVIEDLLDVPGGAALLRQIDLLIDGPFEASQVSDSPIAGSSNQRLLLLSHRLTREHVAAANQPRIAVGIEQGRVRLVGAGAAVPHMHRLARFVGATSLGADETATTDPRAE